MSETVAGAWEPMGDCVGERDGEGGPGADSRRSESDQSAAGGARREENDVTGSSFESAENEG